MTGRGLRPSLGAQPPATTQMNRTMLLANERKGGMGEGRGASMVSTDDLTHRSVPGSIPGRSSRDVQTAVAKP